MPCRLRHLAALASLVLSAAPVVRAQDAPAPAAPSSPADRARALGQGLASSFVQIDWVYQPDRGELPRSMSARYQSSFDRMVQPSIDQERPFPGDGYLLTPTLVVTADFMVADRFAREVRVRFGEHEVAATVAAVARRQTAVFLELEAPLPGTTPLTFSPDAPGPYWYVAYARAPWSWFTSVDRLPGSIWMNDLGEAVISVQADAVLVSESGGPVGMSFSGEVHVERPWRRDPREWDQVSADDLAKRVAQVEAEDASSLVRAHLAFRSPRHDPSAMMSGRYAEVLTDWTGLAVVTGERQAVVLASLDANQTARLERIELYLPGATEPVAATFAGSLRDYGALVVNAERAVGTAARLAAGDVRTRRGTLLLYADVRVLGASRVVYAGRTWFSALRAGWKDQVEPVIADRSSHVQQQIPAGAGQMALFTFGYDGELVTLPISRRKRVAARQQYGRSEPVVLPSEYLREVLADLPGNVDPGNVPLSKEEEGKVAWLGVELQPLGPDLARANGVGHLTQGGARGALVVHVYPDSPGAEAGLQVGDVLLRLYAEGQPKPLEIQLEDTGMYRQGFPWAQLDQLPEQYFDQIPTPWAPLENSFTRALADLGFGTPFTIELFRSGEVQRRDLKVTAGPPHFFSAPRYESEELGVTVADLTFEVRRYLQRGPDEPGVVVARVRPGSRASVAGVRPYELVTHVNDDPVHSVEEFREHLEAGGKIRLSLKRMHRGRIVSVDLGG